MIPLFIDCDPGIDDAIALGYALCSPAADIVGVAATGGNVDTAQTVSNALGWLALAGRRDIPVHPGAPGPLVGEAMHAGDTHGPTGTGYASLPEDRTALSDAEAAAAWVAAARAHPGRLVGVVLGPCTNLALALELEPELPRLLRRLFIMGGSINYRGNTRPTTEWNITYDPEAAQKVLAEFGGAGLPADRLPVLAPLGVNRPVTESIELRPERLERILASATRGTASPGTAAPETAWHRWLAELSAALRFYFEFHESDGHGSLAHIHDPFVLAAALGWARDAAPHADTIPYATTAPVALDVEVHGTLTRGETVADWLGRWGTAPTAAVVTAIDASGFLDHLESVLTGGVTPAGG